MTTITLSIDQSGSSARRAAMSAADAGIGNEAVHLLPSMPSPTRLIAPLTDTEQAYFWTHDWQASERSAEAELQRGEAPTFTTLNEGMRWLLSHE